MSGATLTRTANGVVVQWVNSETPAAEAGLRAGDMVTHIDDEPAQLADPAQLRLRLQEAGRVVRLQVKRGKESLRLSMTLRRLI